MSHPKHISFIQVNADNVSEHGIFCLKNKKAPGYNAKVDWFKSKFNEGLKIIIAKDDNTNKQVGFVEFMPSELAWRPLNAKNYLFIQCIALFVKDAQNQNIGSNLVQQVIAIAKDENKDGICAMTSKGTWIANKSLFLKNGFEVVSERGRFELVSLAFKDENKPKPSLNDWAKSLDSYKGWNLVYADQCPFHEKAVTELTAFAVENGIQLKVKKLNSPEEAQLAPSGFGTFSLINNGKLLADHYISRRRFENILKKEMN